MQFHPEASSGPLDTGFLFDKFIDLMGGSRILSLRHIFAGICKHVKSISAITNPLVNSYKRLVPGYEAPCYIAWTTCNRSSTRVPTPRVSGTRIRALRLQVVPAI